MRELSHSQRRLMDEFARDPDASNDELAARLGWSASYVEKILRGVYAVYRVESRTGAVVTHLRRTGKPRRRHDPDTMGMGL